MEKYGPGLATPTRLLTNLPYGHKVECDIRDHVQRHIYFQGVYEPIEAYLFHLLARPGSVVVDAGANVGQYSLIASSAVGPTGVVHAFEPVQKNLLRVQAHVERNQATNVKLNKLALWHEAAELSFGLPPGDDVNDGSYSVGAAHDSATPVVDAIAVRFDDYAKDHVVGRVELVKMDIEGAELSALRGMTETLQRDKPILLMEVNRKACSQLGYDPEALWELLVKQLGYQPWKIGISAQAWAPLPNPGTIEQANVLFVPGELPPSVATGWDLKHCLRWARGGTA
jgi:FkbM family methyltransferase